MTNYFRITAYHKNEDISIIMDSNGMYEEIWQFSAYLISKGFTIIEVGDEKQFDYGNMPKIEQDKHNIIIRACKTGKPNKINNKISINGKTYTVK